MKILSGFFLIFLVSGCTKKPESDSASQLSAVQLVERGKAIYNLNCIACHNPDPTKDGATGPSLSDSSKELIEARVLRATYPAGYKAKRDSKVMPPLPHLEKEIPALQAFLNATN